VQTRGQQSPIFGFWWSAGDVNNRIALYSGTTLYRTFSTADLLTFLKNGSGTITATNGTAYQTSAYFGNPNLAAGSNDSAEPSFTPGWTSDGSSLCANSAIRRKSESSVSCSGEELELEKSFV